MPSDRALFRDELEYFTPIARTPYPNRNASIPQLITLHVCPSACGRRMAISAFRDRTQDRRARLYISEEDIVSGCYEDLIPDAVEELLRRKKPRPRAICIMVTCIDDLLGTDHEALLRLLRERFPDTKFCIHRVDPIGMETRILPPVGLQAAYYGMLEPVERHSDAVNLVGSLDRIAAESELYTVLHSMGIAVRQIEDCRTFDDFLAMSSSRLNLVVTPMGLLAAQNMEKTLGIPYLYAPGTYDTVQIADTYAKIASFFDRPLPDLAAWSDGARRDAEETVRQLGGMPLAVSPDGDFRPASLARTLLGYGFNVRLVLMHLLYDGDRTDLDWLKKEHPEVQIASDVGSGLVDAGGAFQDGLCIGFSGAYALGAGHLVDFPTPKIDYGFHAVHMLMGKLRDGAALPADYGALMKNSEVWKK